VHLLTVNRYLAERDAAFATPLHEFSGLRAVWQPKR
jgi:preprotein translocase subunit SecA